jgi:hypothetical protein
VSKNEPQFQDDEDVSDTDARKVLERAIQIDAQRAGNTTVGELKRVAEELNISSIALMQALQEMKSVSQPAVAPPRAERKPNVFRRSLGWVRTIVFTWVAGVAGAGIGGENHLGGGDDLIGGVVMMTLAALAITIYDQTSKKSVRRARIDILFAFAAFIFAFGRSSPSTPHDLFEVTLMGLTVAMIGTIVLPRLKLPGSKSESKQEFTAA